MRGDRRILGVLQEKDEQAYHDIGDPSVVMGVFDSGEEEGLNREAMAEGRDAKAFDEQYRPETNEGDDLLALFLGTGIGHQPDTRPDNDALPIDSPLSLFPDHYTWAKESSKYNFPILLALSYVFGVAASVT